MILLDENKRQLEKDFDELAKAWRRDVSELGEFNEEEFLEELQYTISNNVIPDVAKSKQWLAENKESKAVFNAIMDGNEEDSELILSRDAQQIILQDFIYNERGVDDLIMELSHPEEIYHESQLIIPAPFCEECGADLWVCDKCGKKFEDGETLYCWGTPDSASEHLCKKCYKAKREKQ